MSQPVMNPSPGSRIVRYAGDRFRFSLSHPEPGGSGWKAFLRTNLTRANEAREEIISLSGARPTEPKTFAGHSWRDIPLPPTGNGWELDLALTEVGFFRAKAYCLDPEGRQHWPDGVDVGLSVHPDHLRTGNTIYCAFPRMFGESRTAKSTRIPALEEQLKNLDQQGFTVIPPSGKLRDLTACVPHIVETLGCRILHLLPIGPTPTTYARMGRFGSPYALLDFTGIDPALVDFDKRTTAVDQFRELAYAVHLRGGLVFLDIVVNHTGWGSRLLERRPDWFKRAPDGTFHSPGAWGVTWGDLVELDNSHPQLWEATANALLTWCRRGVDGFRCDAGYMVPLPAWQYIVARVRQEFPDSVFLLEGLGGAWEATEALLSEGGMQWAYSELFQNYSPEQVSGYLDHFIRQSPRVGPLVNYSETHDNERLAKQGLLWSHLRNRLCALSSQCGTFGFTAGVEWLATERIEVHQARGMNWGAEPNLVPELSRLNRLLKDHPCFFDGAVLERLSPDASPILALRRLSQDRKDQCLVLVNLDLEAPRKIELAAKAWQGFPPILVDLLEQEPPRMTLQADGGRACTLGPGDSFCLAASHAPVGLAGDPYRALRAQAAWAYRHLAQLLSPEKLGPADWRALGTLVAQDPCAFLGLLPNLDPEKAQRDLMAALQTAEGYRRVVSWCADDVKRNVPVPPGHWLLVHDDAPFEITLRRANRRPLHLRSIAVDHGCVAAIFPAELAVDDSESAEAELILDRFSQGGRQAKGHLRLLSGDPTYSPDTLEGLVLLTNGRGAMARLHANLGAITSKYDCLLGANLHPTAPCDRHVFAKRARAWINADGFITALDGENLTRFEPGPPARWVFLANAGDGHTTEIELTAEMLPGRNATVLTFRRPSGGHACSVNITVRVDLEDRGFHSETHADPGLDSHFNAQTKLLDDRAGFSFEPAPDRRLRCWCSSGSYHPEPEWSLHVPHPVEASRGMAGSGDAWSPGWFDLPMAPGSSAELVLSADAEVPPTSHAHPPALPQTDLDTFGAQLLKASSAFLVDRDGGKTVIAGYPWFLDWGRDTLISARGLLAAGFRDEVKKILLTYAGFEDRGTLPNMLSADSTANRDTSDAPLWFALACEEAAARLGEDLYRQPVSKKRTLLDVLTSIAKGYRMGTPNGIAVDADSGLVWSPAHFTWMDTNYPAGTPREGYPVEIQALWIRLLRQLERLRVPGEWGLMANRATASLSRYWDEERGCLHDVLAAPRGKPAALATPDGLIRPNQLFPVAFGLIEGARARRIVESVARFLLIPGALRSLAPLPVSVPLAIQGADGKVLNDPLHPYWGHYEGDEDTQRKPAYHNGTAWCWLLPTFCESLARAWSFSPDAVEAARAYLGSSDRLLKEGCAGQLPEILDGDSPHFQRGCDAQAWSATEALRVWLLLADKMEPRPNLEA